MIAYIGREPCNTFGMALALQELAHLPGELSVETTLMVIGLNQRTAPVAVRERFWISDDRRYAALVQLSQAEGIEEVIVLATGNRTEFLLWASDPSCAANSVLHLLTTQYGLKI